MRFNDLEIKNLNITYDCINDIYLLLAKYLCGIRLLQGIKDPEAVLMKRYIKEIEKEGKGIKYEQFNELMLILDLDRVSKDFFEFFFEKFDANKDGYVKLEELKQGIEYYRGLSILSYGSLEFVFESCRLMESDELELAFSPYYKDPTSLVDYFRNRPPIVLDIQEIKKEETWMLGYVSGTKLLVDIKRAQELISGSNDEYDSEEIKQYLEILNEYKSNNNKNEIIALDNTDIYLTWDYLDLYFATSMREKWEYEETYDFIEQLFCENKDTTEKELDLNKLNLRYFNPTQSICNNPRNKGLIEGLMLKRGRVTIYMGQETDTLGKDSELAATLAQKNPVIAFYPLIDENNYWKEIEKRPLYYFSKRIYVLNAEGVFDQIKFDQIFKQIHPFYNEILSDFVDQINIFYKKDCPFNLNEKQEGEFKKRTFECIKQKEGVIKKVEKEKVENLIKVDIIEYKFDVICKLLAIAEKLVFEKRAEVMRLKHPLAMQIDLESGVANGVLIVREVNQCRELLYKLLTNSCEFEIIHILFFDVSLDEWNKFSDKLNSDNNVNILNCIDYYESESFIYAKRDLTKVDIASLKPYINDDKIPYSIKRQLNELENIGITVLKESISNSYFRVVTDDRKITNSFWNLFYKHKEE